ncbi:MAG TPA: tetratricopeptide repeat protein, partial [Blastocatellia bacterium]|nr:tetratricopeptide repeat protein [Blastocatellia bacterium]
MTTTLEVGKLEMLLKQGDFVQACTEADLRVGEFESATESGATPDANSVCLLAAATIDLGLYYSYTKSFDDGDRWLQKAEDVLNTARKLVPDNLEVQCILGRLAYERSDLRGLALFDAVLASPAAGIELKKAAFRWKSATYREAGRLDEARHAISDARTRFGPNTLEVVVEEAWLAFGERNYKGALSQFKAAMALSTDENTMAGALSCLIALGRNIEARRLFEGPAASVAPTRRMSILFSCAWALYMSNDCEEALKAFDFIIGEDSAKQYPYAYEMKADTLRRLRQYDQALNCCHEALALFPKDEGLVNEKGFVLYYSREFREALKYFDAPDVRDTPFARLYRNATLREMNRYDEATDAVSRALAESPENTDLLLEKATVFFERCKYDEAISICKGILDSNPESGDAKERLAACFRKLGKHEEARQVVEKALADCPADSDLWHELAMNYYAQGELEKAAESLLTAIKWDNTVLEYEFTLAEILNRLNRYSEALARILELKQRFPECMEVKQRCAGLLLTRHRRAEARQAFEEIPDTHSSAAALGANGLGAVLLDTREYAAAANEFQNAINICGYKEPQFLLNLAYSFL